MTVELETQEFYTLQVSNREWWDLHNAIVSAIRFAVAQGNTYDERLYRNLLSSFPSFQHRDWDSEE